MEEVRRGWERNALSLFDIILGYVEIPHLEKIGWFSYPENKTYRDAARQEIVYWDKKMRLEREQLRKEPSRPDTLYEQYEEMVKRLRVLIEYNPKTRPNVKVLEPTHEENGAFVANAPYVNFRKRGDGESPTVTPPPPPPPPQKEDPYEVTPIGGGELCRLKVAYAEMKALFESSNAMLVEVRTNRNKELASYTRELAEKQADKERLLNQVAQLEKVVACCQEEKKQLEAVKPDASLEKELLQLRSENASLKDKVQQESARADEAVKQVNNLKQDLVLCKESAQSKFKDLEDRLSRADSLFKEEVSRREQAELQFQKLQENVSLSQDGAQAKVKDLEEKLSQLNVTLASSQQEVKDMRLALEKSSATVESLREELAACKAAPPVSAARPPTTPQLEKLFSSFEAEYERWRKVGSKSCTQASAYMHDVLQQIYPLKYGDFEAQSGMGALESMIGSANPSVKAEGVATKVDAGANNFESASSLVATNSLGGMRSLSEVYTSPVLVHSLDWQTSMSEETLIEVLSFPSACFTGTEKKPMNKLENLIASSLYYRTGFKLSFLFDANAHYKGRLMFAWDVNGRVTNYIGKAPPSVTPGLVRMASSCLSVDIDISVSSCAELDIPFASIYNYFATDRTTPRPLEGFLGNLLVFVLDPLAAADPTKMPQEIPIRISASCIDAEFVGSKEPRPLQKVVMKGPMGQIKMSERHPYVAQAGGNTVLSAFPASLSQDSTGAIASTYKGRNDHSLQNYVSHPCIVDSNVWKAGETGLLTSYAVHPMVSGDVSGTTRFPSRLASTAAAFSLWRGDIIFRFSFGASGTHKGKVLFAYQPAGGLPQNAEPTLESLYQMASVTLDLAAEHEVTIRVPYASGTNYSVVGTTNLFSATTPGVHGIGVLHVYQLTPLVSNFPISSGVLMYTYVSGGDNFEFASPRQVKDTLLENLEAQAGVISLKTPSLSYVPRDLSVKELIGVPGLYYVMSRDPGVRTAGIAIPISPSLYVGSTESQLAWFSRHYAFWRGDLNYHFTFSSTEKANITIWHEPNLAPKGYVPYYTNPGTYGGMVSKHVCHTDVNPNITVSAPFASHFHQLTTKGGLAKALGHEANGMLCVSVFPPVELKVLIHVSAGENFEFAGACAPLPCAVQTRVMNIGNVGRDATPGSKISSASTRVLGTELESEIVHAQSGPVSRPFREQVVLGDAEFAKLSDLSIVLIRNCRIGVMPMSPAASITTPLGKLYLKLAELPPIVSPQKVHQGELEVLKWVLECVIGDACNGWVPFLASFVQPSGVSGALDILAHLCQTCEFSVRAAMGFADKLRGSNLEKQCDLLSVEMLWARFQFGVRRTALESAAYCLSAVKAAKFVGGRIRASKATMLRLESVLSMIEFAFPAEMSREYAQQGDAEKYSEFVTRELDIQLARAEAVAEGPFDDKSRGMVRALARHASFDENLEVSFTPQGEVVFGRLTQAQQEWMVNFFTTCAVQEAESNRLAELEGQSPTILVEGTKDGFFNFFGDVTGVSLGSLYECQKLGYSSILKVREMVALRRRLSSVKTPTLASLGISSAFRVTPQSPSLKPTIFRLGAVVTAVAQSHDGADASRQSKRLADRVRILRGAFRAESGGSAISTVNEGNVVAVVCRSKNIHQSGFFVTERRVVLTKHFVDATLGEKISFIVGTKPYSMVLQSVNVKVLHNRDLAIVTLPKGLPGVVDMSEMLIKVNQSMTFDSVFRVSAFGAQGMGQYAQALDLLCPLDAPSGKGYALPTGDSHQIVAGVAYKIASAQGDCGSPIIGYHNGKCFLSHIHVAGSASLAIGYGEAVYFEDLTGDCRPVLVCSSYERELYQSLLASPLKQCSVVEAQSGGSFEEDATSSWSSPLLPPIPTLVVPKMPLNKEEDLVERIASIMKLTDLMRLFVLMGLRRIAFERMSPLDTSPSMGDVIGRPPDGLWSNIGHWVLSPNEGIPSDCLLPPLPSVARSLKPRDVSASSLRFSHSNAALFGAHEGTFALKAIPRNSFVPPQWLTVESIFTILIHEVESGEGSPAGEVVRRALLTHQCERCGEGGEIKYITSQRVTDGGFHPPTLNIHSGLIAPNLDPDPPPDISVYGGVDVLT